MRIVVFQLEVLELEIEDRPDRRVDPHRRQRPRLARKLQPGLFEVVVVEVGVAERVDEVARREPVTWATIIVSSA